MPESPHHRAGTASVAGQSSQGSQPGSPLRYGGCSGEPGGRMEPGSPGGSMNQRREGEGGISPSVVSRAVGGGGISNRGKRARLDPDSWESGSGAPMPMSPEADYRGSLRRPAVPKSLPLSEVQREEERRKSRSQPRMKRPDRLGLSVTIDERVGCSPSSSVYRPSPLSASFADKEDRSPFSPLHKSARPTRPALSRRHTEQVETPPPPPPSARVRVVSNPHHSFDMRNMVDALSQSDSRRPEKYLSPSAAEGYDRYVAHPAIPSPTTIDRSAQQQQLQREAFGSQPVSGTQNAEYIPLGYARPTRELEWNRDGPAMKTHGVAWKRDAAVLASAPEGPRWVQARPPREMAVQGGGWWESGGE